RPDRAPADPGYRSGPGAGGTGRCRGGLRRRLHRPARAADAAAGRGAHGRGRRAVPDLSVDRFQPCREWGMTVVALEVPAGFPPAVQHHLSAVDLDLGYGERQIVHSLSVNIPTGQVSVIIGANGCGKSTLLRGLARLINPSGGRVLLD